MIHCLGRTRIGRLLQFGGAALPRWGRGGGGSAAARAAAGTRCEAREGTGRDRLGRDRRSPGPARERYLEGRIQARASPTGAQITIAALTLTAVSLVVFSLRRPELPEFPPSPILGGETDPGPRDAGEARLLTVDASDPAVWRPVDLARGTVVEAPGPDGWDLAFRRFEARVNGGAGREARAGILDLGDVAFDSVRSVPASGYVGMSARGRDTTHALLDDWYSYSFSSHVLRPAPRLFAVRTARGRHAALEFVSYYCPGAQPGCVTVRYRFVPASES